MIQNLTSALHKKIDKSTWQTYRFDELVHNIVEKVSPRESGLEKYIGLEHLDSDSLKIRRFGKTQAIMGDKLKIYKGDLIFAKRNSYLKRVAIADEDAVASAHSLVLRAKVEHVNPSFLPFFLLSETFWSRAIQISVGSLSPTINWKVLARQEFFLPPKDQQAELAELFWAMDELIERERLVESRTQILLEANRRNLNRGELTEYTGGQLTSLITKGASPKWQGFDYCDEGTLFVTSENIREDSIDISNKKYLPLSFNQKQKRSQLEKGDILINIVGASIGRLAIFNEEIEHANINQAVCLFRVNSKALAEYLVQYILEESNKNRLLNNQSATARPNLSLKNLKDYKFYLPTIQIQKQRIVEITKVKTALKGIQNNISHATSLQKAIINQIF